MAENFSNLFNKIPIGVEEYEWSVPNNQIDAAVSFLQLKVPGVQYAFFDSWKYQDSTTIRFMSASGKSIKDS